MVPDEKTDSIKPGCCGRGGVRRPDTSLDLGCFCIMIRVHRPAMRLPGELNRHIGSFYPRVYTNPPEIG